MPSRILERIQTTACDLFSRTGYAGTSTKAIADAADVTEGSLFRLFGSKAELWKRCITQAVAESFSAERFARSLKGDSFEKRVRNSLAHSWKAVRLDHVRLVNYALLETPELAREIYLREVNIANATLAHLIDEERKLGRIRADVHSDTAAEMLLLVAFRVRFLASCHPPRSHSLGSIRTSRDVLDHILDIWLQGITNPAFRTPRKSRRNQRSK